MRDLPGVVDLSKAEGGSGPHVLNLTISAGALDVFETVAEGHVASDGDAQVGSPGLAGSAALGLLIQRYVTRRHLNALTEHRNS